MRYKPIVVLFMVAVLLICAPSAAHPGSTDEDGGHRDSSTGEYHYHHGYPAHQHENGVCPYEYDDKTGQNSGGASNSSSSSQNYMSFDEWMERQNASYVESGIISKSPEEIGSEKLDELRREWAAASPSPDLPVTPSPALAAIVSPTPFESVSVVSASSSDTVSGKYALLNSWIVFCVDLLLLIFSIYANRRSARNDTGNNAIGCFIYILALILIGSFASILSSCDAKSIAESVSGKYALPEYLFERNIIPLCILGAISIISISLLISEWVYETKMRAELRNLKRKIDDKACEVARLKEFIDASGIADPDRMIPPGSKIGADGLPCESTPDQRFRWGETYTFFASRYGIAFHRYGCESSGNACQCNALHVYGKKRACRVCKPVLPDLSWFFEYQKRKEMQDIIP